jgi:hypothetical protein
MSRTDKDTPDSRKAIHRILNATPPRSFINHIWASRERQAARIGCLSAAKEYRGGGEADTTPTVRQHRHGAQWLWS